jgi:hypothetical protein
MGLVPKPAPEVGKSAKISIQRGGTDVTHARATCAAPVKARDFPPPRPTRSAWICGADGSCTAYTSCLFSTVVSAWRKADRAPGLSHPMPGHGRPFVHELAEVQASLP